MKLTDSFVTTLRDAPKDALTINHQLLVRAGFVRQLMAGVYTYLPLGLKVLNKISQIVREEMNEIGSTEVLMPILHPAINWKITGGYITGRVNRASLWEPSHRLPNSMIDQSFPFLEPAYSGSDQIDLGAITI